MGITRSRTETNRAQGGPSGIDSPGKLGMHGSQLIGSGFWLQTKFDGTVRPPLAVTAKVKMQRTTVTKRIFINIFSRIDLAAQKAIFLADAGYAGRHIETVQRSADFLLSLNLPAYLPIAKFYTGLFLFNYGSGDLVAAKKLLEQAMDEACYPYNDRAACSVAALAVSTNDYSTAMRMFEQLSDSTDQVSRLNARMGRATVWGLEGSTTREIVELESLYPEIKSVSPRLEHLKAHYCNNAAVALKEKGNLEHAKKASMLALGSPIARSFSEFGKTARDIDNEIDARNRGSLVVGPWGRQTFTDLKRIEQVWRIKAVTGNSRLSANDLRIYADAGEAALWG